ncbi:MAG: hypothetical protein NTW38_01440 [Candidatus Aminicenantes bacterium]|nr:hypothetical protein [Candidatus Aminicenantes bacterium]
MNLSGGMKAIILLMFLSAVFPGTASVQTSVVDLLPEPEGWMISEPPQKYLPETLFEYIDGAAENFLSYDFVELALGRYRGAGGAEMTVEIYDMGAPDNAFGIYGSERYPDSRFLPIGVQGYIEDGVLNFFAGRFYVKLLAYPAGTETEAALKLFAAEILKGIPEPGAFPLPVRAFPKDWLVENSEKFILRDFLGLAFLSRGFIASYRPAEAADFEAFIIEAENEAGARRMFEAIIGRFSGTGPTVARPDAVVRLKDPYLANILIVPEGRFLCGATKIKDGAEKAGEKIVLETAKSLGGK